MEMLQNLFQLIFPPTAIVASMAWIIKTLFSQNLSRDLENHKARLQAENEQARQELQTRLQAEAFRSQKRFETFHQKQVQVIGDTFGHLSDAVESISHIVQWGQFGDEDEQQAVLVEAMNTLNTFIVYHRKNKIYLEENISERLDALAGSLRVAFVSFQHGKDERKIDFRMARDYWKDAQSEVEKTARPIMKELEAQFRKRLADTQ